MARIADDLIARLKAEVPLERLIASAGVELVRRGKDLVGRCPFHEPDEEPSLVVTSGKGLWRCFGCDKGGTAIDWRMEISGESFRAAVASLAATYLPGVELEEPAAAQAEPFSPEEVERWLSCSDEELMQRVAGYYRERLDADPRGREYLGKRGLLAKAMVERFGIGFADRSLGQRLPLRVVKAGEAIRGRLMVLGVLRQESGHEHLNGSLVVPIRDLSGRVVQIYGRKVTSQLRKGTPLHLYLPGSLDHVFHPEALVSSDELILCESILDALTFWKAGFQNVSCSYGVANFPPSLLAAMLAHGTRRVLLAYDRDEPGERAVAQLGERLQAEGIECFRILFPHGMDANEYACKVQPAEKSLGLAIRSAQWLGKGRSVAVNGAPMDAETAEESLAIVECEPAAAARGEAASLAASATASVAQAPRPAATSPAPPRPLADVPVEISGEEAVLWLGDRRYRVRGLSKNLSFDALRVNLLASHGDSFHVDTLDLYSARARLAFAKQAAVELGIAEDVARHDVGRVFLKLEELQEQMIRAALAPQQATAAPAMSEGEREEGLAFLRDPHLVERLRDDFARCGIVGEESNTLVGYFAATSRKLETPLAVLVQSSSAAGKSALLEAILAMMPEEERVKYSAMTGQSLFYMSEQDLRHKILALVEEEGAQRASYALKLLQSEGELTIASTGKDPHSGRLVTHEYRVEGPVAILLTTTAVDLDEELLNRCLVLTVDEDREQTRAIHRKQRESWTREGLLRKEEREAILARHRNAQRLLRALPVLNAYAPQLEFLDTQVRTRRDHKKYLTLIAAIALLHQHQRQLEPVVTLRHGTLECLPVALSDIALANELAHEVLGRTLDELPPQTRRLLVLLDAMVAASCTELRIERGDYRFLLREVRAWTGWGQTQLRLHLARLVDLEYVVTHRGGRGQSFVYELVYDGRGEDGRPFLPKLIDVAALQPCGYDANLSGFAPHLSDLEAHLSGSNRPQIGPETGPSRVAESAASLSLAGANGHAAHSQRQNGISRRDGAGTPSYPLPSS